jgi:hypothetical protein
VYFQVIVLCNFLISLKQEVLKNKNRIYFCKLEKIVDKEKIPYIFLVKKTTKMVPKEKKRKKHTRNKGM